MPANHHHDKCITVLVNRYQKLFRSLSTFKLRELFSTHRDKGLSMHQDTLTDIVLAKIAEEENARRFIGVIDASMVQSHWLREAFRRQ